MTVTAGGSMRSELVALRRTLARLEEQAGIAPEPAAAPPSGYGVVVPGEIVAAAHMNRATAQGVMRFATAAARDAAIPTGDRVVNMFTALDTAPGLPEYWNGTTWARGTAGIYRGTFTRTTDASVGFAVVTAAELGMPAAPVGCVASLTWASNTTATDPQWCTARISGGTNIQVRVYSMSAGTAGTVALVKNTSVTVHVIAW